MSADATLAQKPVIDDKVKLPGRIGGAIGFVAYLVVGLIPSLLFGGHAGMLIFIAIYDHMPITKGQDPEVLVGNLLVGGGMVLGFVIGLFCFVLLGWVVAQGIANLTYYKSAQNQAEKGK